MVIPNSVKENYRGVINGSNGRLIFNEKKTNGLSPQSGVAINRALQYRMGNVLRVNRGKRGMKSSINGWVAGDRMALPPSEPNATVTSRTGFKGKFNWDTPTTVAPMARMAFAGGGADSVPTVTPMTATQGRLATSLTKRRMARRAGKHFAAPYQRPALYDRSATRKQQAGPVNEGNRRTRKSTPAEKRGNLREGEKKGDNGFILSGLNQDDVSKTAISPNNPEGVPVLGPVDRQGNQYANYYGEPKLATQPDKNFPWFQMGDPTDLEKRRMFEADF